MRKKKVNKYPTAFRKMALERLKNCSPPQRWQLDPLHSAEGAPVPTKTLSRLISLPREGIVFRRASALAGNRSMLRMEAGISMEGESINPFPRVDLLIDLADRNQIAGPPLPALTEIIRLGVR